MTIDQNYVEFFGLPVVDFEKQDDWKGPSKAYRVSVDYDTATDEMGKRYELLSSQADSDKLTAIIVGAWMGDDSSNDSSTVIQHLVALAPKLPALKAIFVGDITYEENEMSWIEQSDLAPLLAAYPGLELLQARGGNSLSISQTTHENLKSLIIETGGMPRSVLRDISRCSFPNLEHLELWLGTGEYGWDGGVEDLQPILTGKLFPKLSYLGLRNSDAIDEIAPVLPNAPLISQLRVLDLSLGSLSDVGARPLLALASAGNLKKLDLSHHYIAPEVLEELKAALPFEVVANDPQEADDEWRNIYVSE
ncbi:STM4015 family protein [Bremerella sp. JC817]|uniref:STM4015 family protein n=1 Tax=Bremerella sp. JC817 TaxID=3231756 RepID=UPI00345AD6A7